MHVLGGINVAVVAKVVRNDIDQLVLDEPA